MSEELKVCPFCDASPVSNPYPGATVRSVVCMNEKCLVKPSTVANDEDAAAKNWNTRVDTLGPQSGPLEPCPFCGADAVFFHWGADQHDAAKCSNPECNVAPFVVEINRHAVSIAWNTRAGEKA